MKRILEELFNRNRSCLFFLMFLSFCCGCTPEYYKLNQRGQSKIIEKDFEGAQADFEPSIKLNETYWASYLNRGASYAKSGDCKNAIADFNRSISLHTNNPLAFDNRGLCKLMLRDSVGALADFKQALKFNDKFNIVYTHLGVLLSQLDSCEQSVRYLKIALERKAFDDCHNEQLLQMMKSTCENQAPLLQR